MAVGRRRPRVASERDLADIIFNLGEERHSRAVARAIVAARRQSPSSPPARLPTSSAASSMVGPATFIRQRGRSRRCGCSSTTSFTNSKEASRRPNAS